MVIRKPIPEEPPELLKIKYSVDFNGSGGDTKLLTDAEYIDRIVNGYAGGQEPFDLEQDALMLV